MTPNGPDDRGSLPRLSGTSKNLPRHVRNAGTENMIQELALSPAVTAALAAADRSPGWNNRPRDVRRFDVGTCALYVVPYRRWAYRRQEQQTAAWWRTHMGEAGQA